MSCMASTASSSSTLLVDQTQTTSVSITYKPEPDRQRGGGLESSDRDSESEGSSSSSEPDSDFEITNRDEAYQGYTSTLLFVPLRRINDIDLYLRKISRKLSSTFTNELNNHPGVGIKF